YYTLSGVSAIVLGGVSLAGGRGGMLGPLAAAYILSLIPAVLLYLGIDPNYGQMIQGVLIVIVVMIGGIGTVLRRACAPGPCRRFGAGSSARAGSGARGWVLV